MNSPHDVALDPECSSLLSFQDSLHGLFNSRLGSQAKQIAAKLPMAANHFNSLSRAGKITLTCGCGLFLWWLYARYNRKTKIVPPQAPQRNLRLARQPRPRGIQMPPPGSQQRLLKGLGPTSHARGTHCACRAPRI